jgi:hypothetical protein
MKAHHRSNGYLLTPVLMEIRRTRAESLLQWHAKNEHDNSPFTDEKIFIIEKHTTTRTRFMLKRPLRCVPRMHGGHHPSYVMVWWGMSHQAFTALYFCEKGVKLVPECNKRTCYKEL